MLNLSSTALIFFLQAYAAEKTVCGTIFTSAIQDYKEEAHIVVRLPYKTCHEPADGAED
jgi:hypothetical protein